jgi:hypothetical protein
VAVAFFARAGLLRGAAASIASAVVAWAGTFFGARFAGTGFAGSVAAFVTSGAAFAAGLAGAAFFAAPFAGGVDFAGGAFFATDSAAGSGWERRCAGLRAGGGLPAEVVSSFAGPWNVTAGAAFGRRGARSAGLLGGVG